MGDTGGIQGQGSAPASQIAQFRSDGVSAQTGLRIPFFSDDYARAFGFPPVRLKNMVSESSPVREERPYAAYVGLREIRYSRPGMVAGFNYGTGPVRGTFSAPGVFGAAVFIVSGTTIYRDGSNVGTIPGSDLVRWAASPSQLVAVANGIAYLYDGVTITTFTAIDNGVLPAIADVAYLAGRFIYVCQGTTRFYYSDVLDAASVDGLSFASTNDSPAPIIAVEVLDDQLVFFTGSSIEFWGANGSAGITDSAFIPSLGRGYQRGCLGRDTAVYGDNAIFWVGDNGSVYRSTNIPQRISNSSVEDAIRRSTDLAGMTAIVVTFEGHQFYVLNVPGVGSFAYDMSRIGTTEGAYGDSYGRGEWAEWSSFGRTVFRGRTAAFVGGKTYIGDDTTNDVWLMQVGVWADGTDPLIRQASAFIKIEEGRPRMDALILHCVTGIGNAVDPGSAPVVEMRYSDDMGRMWSRWRPASLGAQGDYKARAAWQRLGQMRAPGRLIEVRASDPVDVAYSHLELNPMRPAQ